MKTVLINDDALTPLDRGIAAFLWLLLAIGSITMWIGIPAGWLWVAGQIASDQTQHILLSILGVPLAMITWARGLFWISRLYLRVTQPKLMKEIERADEDDEPWTLRGPLESLLMASLLVAIIVVVIWFFFFAERPPSTLSTQ